MAVSSGPQGFFNDLNSPINIIHIPRPLKPFPVRHKQRLFRLSARNRCFDRVVLAANSVTSHARLRSPSSLVHSSRLNGLFPRLPDSAVRFRASWVASTAMLLILIERSRSLLDLVSSARLNRLYPRLLNYAARREGLWLTSKAMLLTSTERSRSSFEFVSSYRLSSQIRRLLSQPAWKE
jgi:hypothetical protein